MGLSGHFSQTPAIRTRASKFGMTTQTPLTG